MAAEFFEAKDQPKNDINTIDTAANLVFSMDRDLLEPAQAQLGKLQDFVTRLQADIQQSRSLGDFIPRIIGDREAAVNAAIDKTVAEISTAAWPISPVRRFRGPAGGLT